VNIEIMRTFAELAAGLAKGESITTTDARVKNVPNRV